MTLDFGSALSMTFPFDFSDIAAAQQFSDATVSQSTAPVARVVKEAWATSSLDVSDNRQHAWDEESESQRDSVSMMEEVSREKVGHDDAATELQVNRMAEDTVKQGRNDKGERTMKAQHGKHNLKGGSFHYLPDGSPKGLSDDSPDDSPMGLPKVLKHCYMDPKVLPDDFQPSGVDVICGRGKGAMQHPGNKRFRAIIAINMKAYQNAKERGGKRRIVNAILDRAREYSTTSGGFVERDPKTGKWKTLDNTTAREKVKHAMRDALSAAKNSNQVAKDTDKLHYLAYAMILGDEDRIPQAAAADAPSLPRKKTNQAKSSS